MKLQTARTTVYGCMGAAVFFALIYGATRSTIIVVLSLLALAAEMIVFFGFIRCPHCGEFLDRIGMKSEIKVCPFCGREIE